MKTVFVCLVFFRTTYMTYARRKEVKCRIEIGVKLTKSGNTVIDHIKSHR